jgi:Fe-S-cluster containining protein
MDKRQITRSCGPCRGCCKPFAVPEVGKEDANWCQHSSPKGGCAIYDKRPYACRAFTCAWLHGIGDESYRPDILGVFITMDEFKLGARNVAIIHFWEVDDGASERPIVKELIEANKEGGHIVSVHKRIDVNGYEARFTFSRKHFSEMEATLFNISYRR